jgi:hypothetical protein
VNTSTTPSTPVYFLMTGAAAASATVQAERLDLRQHAVQCRPVQQPGEYGMRAVPPRHQGLVLRHRHEDIGARQVNGAVDYDHSIRSINSAILDLVREQPKGLVGPDPVDGLPVLGNESVLDAEEVKSREVRRLAAPGERAIPHASKSARTSSSVRCAPGVAWKPSRLVTMAAVVIAGPGRRQR